MSFSPEVWREGLTPIFVLGGVAGASFLLYLLGGEKVSKWLESRGKTIKTKGNGVHILENPLSRKLK